MFYTTGACDFDGTPGGSEGPGSNGRRSRWSPGPRLTRWSCSWPRSEPKVRLCRPDQPRRLRRGPL